MTFFILIGVSLLVLSIFTKRSWLLYLLALLAFMIYFGWQGANLYYFLLFAFGMALLVVELYVPDLGLAGLLGLILAFVGLWLKIGRIELTLLILLGAIIWSVIEATLLLNWGFQLQMSPRFVLDKTIGHSSENQSELLPDLSQLIGETGVARTNLKPVGKIQLGEKLYQAFSQDELIEAGSKIIIVGYQSNQLYVRRVK